jgi:5'-3' exonuclease
MANTVIIDANALGYANHNATKLTVGDFQVQAIFGFLKTIRNIREEYQFPDWQIVVLWDGHSAWRKELCPEYKANRVAKDEKQLAHKEAYKKQVPFIRKALQLLGVRQMLVSSAEADDMAGVLAKRLSVNNLVTLITGDKDWLQLVNNNTVWYDPIRDNRVGVGNFFEFTGYQTREGFLDGKALMGDNSDNISGVGGIGEKGAPEFIAEFGSVDNYFKQVDDGKFVPKKKAHERLASEEGRKIFYRNRHLMNLLDVPTPPQEDVNVMTPTYNKEVFRNLCEKLAFQSFLRDFDNFLKPFEGATT